MLQIELSFSYVPNIVDIKKGLNKVRINEMDGIQQFINDDREEFNQFNV